MYHITTQLYLPSKAKKYWGCPKISTVQWGERERKRERVKEDRRSISEPGKRAKGRAKPFSISRRDCMGRRATELRRLLSSSGFYHYWGILAGRERKRDPMATSVCRGRSVSPRAPLSSQDETERREGETPTSKGSLISEVHRSANLKEDLRQQLKGEYKGHTVTDAGQWNVAALEFVQRRNPC